MLNFSLDISRKRQKRLAEFLRTHGQGLAPELRQVLDPVLKELETNLSMPDGWQQRAALYLDASSGAETVGRRFQDESRVVPALAVILNFHEQQKRGSPARYGTTSEMIAEIPRYVDFMRKVLAVRPPSTPKQAESLREFIDMVERDAKAEDFRERVEAELAYVKAQKRETVQ